MVVLEVRHLAPCSKDRSENRHINSPKPRSKREYSRGEEHMATRVREARSLDSCRRRTGCLASVHTIQSIPCGLRTTRNASFPMCFCCILELVVIWSVL